MSGIDSIRGTRDFYPEEMAVRRWIEDRWRETAERFGFAEMDGPVIEPLELYTRKSGEEIVDQLYAFEDKGDRMIALRPEMTPTVARMIAARSRGLAKPIKWYSVPRLFRYEKPQRGRLREFFQLNLDIVGVEGVEADAEIIAAGVESLRACGLGADDFVVRYSDRRLLDAVVRGLGIPDERREGVYAALDKLLKAGEEAVLEALDEIGVPPETARALVDAVARRDLAGLQEALVPTGVHLAPEARRLVALEAYLEAYGVGEFCEFDAAIVRGLAYYTGIVFEMYDRAGELRALCGGGRYDDLMAAFGGEDLPAVGFGLGDAVLLELLEERDRVPEALAVIEAYVIPVADEDRRAAVDAVTRLRRGGIAADLALKDRSVGKGFQRAEKLGARAAVVIGEAERDAGTWTVKAMASGDEATVSPDEGIERIARMEEER